MIDRHLDLDRPFRLEVSRSTSVGEQGYRIGARSDLRGCREFGVQLYLIPNRHLDAGQFDSRFVEPSQIRRSPAIIAISRTEIPIRHLIPSVLQCHRDIARSAGKEGRGWILQCLLSQICRISSGDIDW